uniref:C-type lectin domain family 3 member B n=1 Tax=Salmo trutta TaxID=8032 RepID=A0A674E944_SALTR
CMSVVCVLLFCLLLLGQSTFQQASSKKTGGKKDAENNAAIEELKKQIDNIVLELNLLKEQQALRSVCLKGIKIFGKCFLADTGADCAPLTRDDCITKGGTISTPLTGDDNDKLVDYVHRSIGPEEHIWLGINDMLTKGEWLGQAGTNLLFKNWETDITNQPDSGRTHNCAILSTTANGKWFDESCRAEKASVCKFNII